MFNVEHLKNTYPHLCITYVDKMWITFFGGIKNLSYLYRLNFFIYIKKNKMYGGVYLPMPFSCRLVIITLQR